MRKLVLTVIMLFFALSAVHAQGKRYTIPLEDSPFLGPANAPVTIVEFIDYQWPHCQEVGSTVEKVMKQFAGKVRLVIKLYPYKYRDYSHISAEAALAAMDQGKFWEMHHLLLRKSPQLARKDLIQYAKDLNLDVNKFTASLDMMKHSKLVERDTKLALDLDLYTTPTFFVNGKELVGNVPYARFKKIIEQELKGARK